MGVARDFATLNPAVESGASGGAIAFFLVYATLVRKNPTDGMLGPGLAHSFGYVGTGNNTYQLKLRPGLKFSDGAALNAEAVKKWLKYVPTAPGTTEGNSIQIASIDTPDNLTVVLHLKVPSPSFSEDFSNEWGMIVSPNALTDKNAMASGAPGAGPYMYDHAETVTGQGATYTLVPNKYYYDQSQIHWNNKVLVKSIPDPDGDTAGHGVRSDRRGRGISVKVQRRQERWPERHDCVSRGG
jgi:peptide/nickel transport system substrate-binding protein